MRIDVRRSAVCFVFSCVLLTAVGARAATADCHAVQDGQERIICASALLGGLDRQVREAYRRLLEATGPAWEERLRRSQQEWLRVRGASVTPQMDPHAAEEALKLSMQSRLLALQGALVSRRGVRMLRIDRAVVQRVDEGLRLHAGDRRQVVQTTILYYVLDDIPGAATFNALMDRRYPMTADPASPADSESDVAADLNFVSPELLSVSVSASSFFFGAAHPMTRIDQINYLLAARRSLLAEDLFATHDYEKIIVARLAGTFLQLGLETDSNAEEIRAQVLDPENWMLSARGLGVVIPPDTLFSHAAGSPDLPLIPWQAFHGCLTPWAQKVFAAHG